MKLPKRSKFRSSSRPALDVEHTLPCPCSLPCFALLLPTHRSPWSPISTTDTQNPSASRRSKPVSPRSCTTGSSKPLQCNIDETAEIVEFAHRAGVSCEGEIGFVGYASGNASTATDPEEARRFAAETGVDAMAVSIGNVHLKETQDATIDLDALREIEAVTTIPLVIHGASGVPTDTRRHLARNTSVCKFNIGTELRKVFGTALRSAVERDCRRFDRNAILAETIAPVRDAARTAIRAISSPSSQSRDRPDR